MDWRGYHMGFWRETDELDVARGSIRSIAIMSAAYCSVRLNHSKCRKILDSLIFVETEVRNNLHSVTRVIR